MKKDISVSIKDIGISIASHIGKLNKKQEDLKFELGMANKMGHTHQSDYIRAKIEPIIEHIEFLTTVIKELETLIK